MNCHHVQSQFAALSAGELPSAECAALKSHCIGCAPCRKEWDNFQHTLLLLSTLSQPLPSSETSCEMWNFCAEEIFVRIEEKRTTSALAPASFWERTLGWARLQPRWGWASLGAAVAIFGSVWLLTPGDAGQSNMAAASLDGGPLLRFGEPETAPGDLMNATAARVGFAAPSAGTSGVVDYHAAMSLDPFADHVGSSLVSSTVVSDASAPTATAPSSGLQPK